MGGGGRGWGDTVPNMKMLSKARRKIGRTAQRVSGKLVIFKTRELYIPRVRQQRVRSRNPEALHAF